MASAYSTGTASSMSTLISALSTFLTSNGWTEWDSISSTDKVFFGPGESMDEAIYVRVTNAAESGAGLLDGHLGYGLSVHDYFAKGRVSDRRVLTFRAYQYWNNTTHTGYGEAKGIFGPMVSWTGGNERKHGQASLGHTDSSPGGTDHIGSAHYAWISPGYASSGYYDTYVCWIRALDLQSGYHQSYRSPQYPNVGDRAPGCMLYSPKSMRHYLWQAVTSPQYGGSFVPVMVGDKMYLYYATTNSSHYWKRIDVYDAPNSHETMTNPPANPLPNSSYGFPICWDGDDYIYCARMGGYTNFYRYSISGNSWSSMATLPQATYRGQFIYAPAEDTGFSEDRIYWLQAGSGDDVYYYNVDGASANTWSAKVDDLYSTNESFYCMRMNDTSYKILTHYTRTDFAVFDMNTHAETWLRASYSDSYNGGAIYLRRRVTDLHVNEGVIQTYHFFCDKDHFKIAIKHDDDKWFWTYAGKIDAYASESYVRTTATSGTGSSVEVSVDAQPDSFGIGDYVMAIDNESDYSEQYIVLSSGLQTVTINSISEAIPSGCMLGIDPAPVGVYSTEAEAWFPTNTPNQDAQLTEGMEPYYDATPLGIPPLDGSGGVFHDNYKHTLKSMGDSINARNHQYQLIPIIVQQGRLEMNAIGEVRGQLKGAYATSVDGNANSGDTVTHEGNTYLTLLPDNGPPTWNYTQYMVCLGPM